MLGFSQPLLINILGHAGGALIFAIFLVLLYSGRGWSGGRGRFLSGLAAALSMAWNLGSLVVLAWPSLPPLVSDVVAALSFSFLSLLPAVLLHLALGDGRKILVRAGYVLSAVAVATHFREIGHHDARLHQNALMLITVGFLILTLIAVLRSTVGGAVNRLAGTRIVASMCLALFAASFLHFGAGHASEAWSSELIVHHAGIPLALFILLQDYRFVLLDAFVRFLANALLAAILTVLVIEAAFRLVLVESAAREPLHEALLLISVCLFLVFFAWLRNRVQGWLTQVVFRQGSVADLPDRVKDSPPLAGEEQYLDWAAATIAASVRTKDFAIVGQKELPEAADLHSPIPAGRALPPDQRARWNWAEAAIPLRLGPGNSKMLLLGRRQGGQRYLGEDLHALGKTAAEISERAESLRQQEMKRLVTQAELRALQSQINPHFLFNALNTLYGIIPRSAGEARRMVLNLADIFRYTLQSNKTYVPFADEIETVRAYLEVEKLRLADRLNVVIDVPDETLPALIPVLSVQPLVENAIKHGLAKRAAPGDLRIIARLHPDELRIRVENSAAGIPGPSAGPGVGLENVRRRLEICYGAAADLRITYGPDETAAELAIPFVNSASAAR